MRITIIYIFILSLCSSKIFAQTDITEQFWEVKSKMDKMNIFLNFEPSFDVYANKNETTRAGFQGQIFRAEIRGNLTERIFYRMRYRLNRSAATTSFDNLSGAADMALAGYRFSDKVSVAIGKMGQNWGGFEYDLAPMNIYDYSDFVYNIDAFLLGGIIYYRPNPSNEFSLNFNNVRGKNFGEVYKNVTEIDEPKLPLGYVFTWDRKILNKKIHTRWSIGYHQEAKKLGSIILILGNKFNFSTWNFFIDYYMAFDQADRLKYANVYSTDNQLVPKVLKNVFYATVVSRVELQLNPKWVYSLQGSYEIANVNQHLPQGVFDNRRRAIGYFAGVEWLPFNHQNLRIFATYVGRSYLYKFTPTKIDNRFSIGFMYRMNVF